MHHAIFWYICGNGRQKDCCILSNGLQLPVRLENMDGRQAQGPFSGLQSVWFRKNITTTPKKSIWVMDDPYQGIISLICVVTRKVLILSLNLLV